ncbi:MAG: ATP-grasp domain-containing protein [Solirubrobacteraceae bacterium]
MPSPQQGTDALITAVCEAIETQRYEVVFSSDDEGVVALSANRELLPAIVPYGSHDTVLRAFDKLELTRAAEAEGIAVPRTIEPTSSALSSWQGPVVVKPALTFAAGSDRRLNTVVLDDPGEAHERVEEILRAGVRAMLQEVIHGDLCAVSVLSDRESQVVALCQQRAELTWPPQAGVSARAITVPCDDDLCAQVTGLIKRLGWFGLAQLQFLADADGSFKLLDFNGRFYGSLALAISAGMDFPAMWARLATDRPLPTIPTPAAGRRYQWFSRDLRASLAESDINPWRSMIDTVLTSFGSTHSVWRTSDPWPAIHHYGGGLLQEGLGRIFGR